MNEIIKSIPQTSDQKIGVDKIRFETLALSLESQKKMAGFVEHLRDEVGNQKGWEETCRKADEELQKKPSYRRFFD